MSDSQIIEETIQYVKKQLNKAEGGHDWWHTYRVWKNAKVISQYENVNLLIVELGALLHDIADSKFHDGDEEIGPKMATDFLQSLDLDTRVISSVTNIVRHISFKGGNFKPEYHSKELEIVQDADRLDALGAIGIARAFNYGGFRNRSLYDPDIKPALNMTRQAYKNNKGPTINHFYEKLLLLKDRMNTPTAKEVARRRHLFMENYLDQFFSEWNGDA